MKESPSDTVTVPRTHKAQIEKQKDREYILSHIVDLAQIGLCYLDTNLRYILINDWLANINGLTVEQHLGRTIRELFPNLAAGVEPQLQQVIDTGNPIIKSRVHAETPAQPGVKRLFEHSYFADKLADGTIVGISCFVEDITEREWAEEKLREKWARLEELVSNVNVIILEGDPYNIYYIGGSPDKILGYPVEKWFADPDGPVGFWSRHLHPDDIDKIRICADAIAKGENHSFEYRMYAANGSIVWFYDTVTVESENGIPTKARTVMVDITDRKLAEKVLQESEARYRNVVEDQTEFIVRWLPDGTRTFVNDSYCKFFEISKDKALGSSLYMLIPEEARERIRQMVKSFTPESHIASEEHEVLLPNGEIGWNLWTIRAIFDVNGKMVELQSVGRDITDHKRAEESLRESERKFRTLVEYTNIIPWKFDLKMNQFSYIGKQVEKVLGYPVESWTDLNSWSNRIHPNDRDTAVEFCLGEIEKGNDHDFEYRYLTAGGDIVWLRDIVTVRKDEKGAPIELVGYMLDITTRMQAEQNIRDLAHIVERSLNEIYIFDAETLKFIQVNHGARENIGYSLEELTKLTPLDVEPKLTKKSFTQIVEPLRNGVTESVRFETVHKRKDGSLYDVEVHLQMSEFLSKPVFVAFTLDITETKRLQKLESRAARLETAGTIAAQVAHDFNNLLAPMISYPDLIREELPRNHPALRYLDLIEQASQKIANINQDLLAMGRRGHYNQEVLNLNTVVKHALSELKPYPKTLVCEVDLSDDLMDILGGGAQLYRMITNLLHNAKDAMEDIGQVTVRTENYYVDDVSLVYGRVPKGEYVKLTISDTGCGISDDIVQKIFDPFFTSKTANKKRGSGLGMSVVDAVIKDHNGYIDLSTKVGEGTSFYIYFPITRELMDSQDLDGTYDGNETILVVDDDEIQCEVSTQLLKKMGYEVNTARSGEKAIEFLKENPRDLVILDMVMPGGIDGTEAYRQILEVRPHQKAIILSGFSESNRVREAQRLGVGAFVKKPVTKQVIAAAVRTELDRYVEVSAS